MNKTLILSIILLILTSSTYSHPHSIRLGMASLYSNTQWERNYGGNLFHKTTQGVGVSAGFMISEHFGIETGYEYYPHKKRSVAIRSGEVVAGGNPMPYGDVVKLRTKIQQSHIPLMLLIKIKNFGSAYALGGLGVSVSKVKAHALIYKYNTTAINIGSIFSNTKILPVIKIGFGYNVKDFAIEATVKEVFNNYWRSHNLHARSKTNALRSIRARNSLTCSLGFIYNISI